ncbi:MAG: phosphodiester glycosidase family protein [Bacteroidales bacterium]|jgi:hypothetical protein|nr:phosphodiester glycosidase family protein [Bacteroidales bacterium]
MKKSVIYFVLCVFVSFTLFSVSCKEDPKVEEQVVVPDPDPDPDPEPEPQPDPDPQPTLAQTITIGAADYPVDSIHIEKIATGIWYLYAQTRSAGEPQIIHSVRFTANTPGYAVETWISKDSVYAHETPSAMINRREAQGTTVRVAINGDFYNTNTLTATAESGGAPSGCEIINGVMSYNLFAPEFTPEPLIGFDANNRPYMDHVTPRCKVKDADDNELPITVVNSRRWADYLVLYNSYAGKRTRTNQWGTEVLCVPLTAQWEKLSNTRNVKCRVEKIREYEFDVTDLEIPKGRIVLSGNGTADAYLRNLSVGDDIWVTVDYELKSTPEINTSVIKNAVSGLNIILHNNVIQEIPDHITNSGDRSVITSNHPRTSAGFSADSAYVFFTVVEGRRTGIAAGVSCAELAQIMQYLGAANAINLDGGGSSALVIDKVLKNYPTDGSQRAVANGLSLVVK